MADEIPTASAGGEGSETRPCAFCGAAIHPASGRCKECGGHVGLAWGTVHREHFLFLLSSILIVVACFCSWSQRWPEGAKMEAGDAETMTSLAALMTLRGPLMLAIAVYGMFVAVFNVVYRRMVMWPFVLNAMLALWVGAAGVARAVGSHAWDAWSAKLKGTNFFDETIGQVRAIPPGFALLSLAGVLIAFTLVKGVVGGFAAGSAKEKAKRDEAAARKTRRAGDGGGAAGPTGVAGGPPPA